MLDNSQMIGRCTMNKNYWMKWMLTAMLMVVAGGISASAQSAPASGVATSVPLGRPHGVAYDTAGNTYIADTDENVIRKVNTAGTITTVAGNGEQGYGGDGGLATAAQLDHPAGVAVDASGNIYIADTHNKVIREVLEKSGDITTIAGTGVAGFSGDGAVATLATLNTPTAVAVDSLGNVYIADTNNHRIREISGTTITTVAGDGEQFFSGDGGAAILAGLDSPNGVAVDAAFNIYIGDTHNQRVRMVTHATGEISTLAGTGEKGFTGDGPADSAALARPRGVAVDTFGDVYLADSDNHRIRSISNGNVATVAGSGGEGFSGDGNLATSALLDTPGAVAISGTKVLFSDTENGRVRQVNSNSINTIAGLASSPTPAVLTTPTPGSTLSTSSVTFTWTTGTGATEYALSVGDISKGSYNLYRSPTLRNTTSVSVSLPINGETLYVTLSSFIGSAWQSNYYTYSTSGTPVLAALTSPAPGSTLTSSSATFQWSAGSGVSGYILALSATNPGSHDLYSGTSTTATSASVTGLPVNGLPIYARLYSHINGSWAQYIDYVYNPATAATLASPTQGTALAATGQVFTWAPVTGATGYTLCLGTSAGGGNLLDAHTTNTTVTTGSLPINGETIYARLWTNFNGVWKYTDSTFTAAAPAALTSPAAGATITAAAGQTFTWAPVGGVTGYTLYLGTSQGGGNLLDAHTTATTVTAGKLPKGTIYARLWTNVNGVWSYTDSNFMAQ
jgi:hypothetical protein